MGVWIETRLRGIRNNSVMSHPSWVCGLKQKVAIFHYGNGQSHPSWVCGLKQQNEWSLNKLMQVTPLVGVWIETCTLV